MGLKTNVTQRTVTFFTNDILLKSKLPGAAIVHLLQCDTELVDNILAYMEKQIHLS